MSKNKYTLADGDRLQLDSVKDGTEITVFTGVLAEDEVTELRIRDVIQKYSNPKHAFKKCEYCNHWGAVMLPCGHCLNPRL